MSWRWDLIDGVVAEDEGFDVNADFCVAPTGIATEASLDTLRVKTPPSELLSELATRSIFGWLRVNGYAPGEKDIYNHEWINLDDSDDEQVENESS